MVLNIKSTKLKEYKPEIIKSKDYDKFKHIVGNRDINMHHVNDMVKIINEINLLSVFPLVVTQDGYLVDGQHRLEACKANDWAFYYLVIPFVLDEIVVALVNSHQLKWRPEDYLNFFAERGNEQYVFLKELIAEYKISLSNAIVLLSGNRYGLNKLLKKGDLKIFITMEEKQAAIDLCKAYIQMRPIFNRMVYIDRDFVQAFRVMIQQVSIPEIIEYVQRAKIEITPQVTSKDYLRVFESVFNRFRRGSKIVRFF